MMDRIPGIDEAQIAAWAQMHHDAAAVGHEDDDLDPSERRDRAEVYAGSVIKRGDDLRIVDAFNIRVVGPGRGADVIIGLPEWLPGEVYQFVMPREYITDRAPLDPEEEPLPIFPEEVPT